MFMESTITVPYFTARIFAKPNFPISSVSFTT